MSLPEVPVDLAAEAASLEKSIAQCEIDEITNAIMHLQRSNEELKAYLAESGPDPDLSQASYDNLTAIATKTERVSELRATALH